MGGIDYEWELSGEDEAFLDEGCGLHKKNGKTICGADKNNLHIFKDKNDIYNIEIVSKPTFIARTIQ